MGRKKRPAAAMAQPTPSYQQHQHPHAAPPPAHRPSYGAPPPGYGIPPPNIPPPSMNMNMMLGMNMIPPVPHTYHAHAPPLPPPTILAPPLPPPSSTPSKIESFTVKKYRPSKHFRCIDAFQRYTKSHRMTDASFTQITPTNRGATLSCPIVFSCKIGGSDLSWGRGKTRDVAIDNACRAAFALVAAHGYTDFDCNEDCLTVEPMQLLVDSSHNNGMGEVPLPPPPLGGVLPPPPMGMMRSVPPPPLPPQQLGVTLIPQGMSLSNQVAVPSVMKKDMSMGMSMGFSGAGTGEQSGGGVRARDAMPISLSLDKSGDKRGKVDTTFKKTTFEKKIKGGLVLLYDPEADGDGVVVTMEMRRARLGKYREVLQQCWEKQRALPAAVQGN